ncbi:LysR family transcriptional regulator [Mucilaginibacter sp. SP1R1]|uniref:LysR family transcriptional regulator n=1 Tax=Mucilaginibacter sp. SP1R1 TaxID=2723091 RepID=UPI001607A114|nr:LysR family transcriptional regulator [Mucilaginibacter sp. SP1R1]MBB6148946.1 DNA-binding transcriptional LysR family regulator [Mucilaginibacter sp. SP1R1]
MNVNDLKIFEAVAAHGSFTKAAEAMFTVQSNVTARIKSLEEEFNVHLFKRTSRTVELTSAGEIFIQYCKKLNHLTETVKQELSATDKLFGLLKIGCIETTMALKIPGVINEFTDKYPDVTLNFKADNSVNLINDVLTYKLDAAFVAAPITAPDLGTQLIKEEKLVITTSEKHPELKEYLTKGPVKIVVFDQGCSYRPKLEAWLNNKGIINYQCTVLNTLEGIINFVEAGIGITIMPEDLITQLYYNRKLKTYPIEGDLGLLTTVITYRNDIPHSNAMKVFMSLFQ